MDFLCVNPPPQSVTIPPREIGKQIDFNDSGVVEIQILN